MSEQMHRLTSHDYINLLYIYQPLHMNVTPNHVLEIPFNL